MGAKANGKENDDVEEGIAEHEVVVTVEVGWGGGGEGVSGDVCKVGDEDEAEETENGEGICVELGEEGGGELGADREKERVPE